jgi:hypothetical protein
MALKTASQRVLDRFEGDLRDIDGVRRVWVGSSETAVQYWILLDQARQEWIERVFDLERELVLQLAPTPVDVFVYGADEVDPSRLPGGEARFERSTR